MKTAVTLCEVTEAAAGPFVYHGSIFDGIPWAARHGFDAVELFLPEAAESIQEKIQNEVTKHGLKVAAVGTGAGMVKHGLSLTAPSEDVRAKALAYIIDFVRFGAALNAPAILGSMQGKSSPEISLTEARSLLADALNTINTEAEKAGTFFLYEPLNRYETNLFNRLDDAAEFLKQHNWSHIKILADLFHMNIEEAEPCAALERNLTYVGHIHFADSNRRAIGMGHTNPAPFLEMLHRHQYNGFLSAEILPLPSPDAAASMFINSTKTNC